MWQPVVGTGGSAGPSARGGSAVSAAWASADRGGSAAGGAGRFARHRGAGRRDQLGIVRWGRGLSVSALASLGLTRGRVPAPSVWCELFQGLDVASLEAALGAWVRGGGAPGHIAIDGKRLRGSATATAPGVHLLAAFSDALGGVIGQLQLTPDSNEITAALELLKTLPLSGGV